MQRLGDSLGGVADELGDPALMACSSCAQAARSAAEVSCGTVEAVGVGVGVPDAGAVVAVAVAFAVCGEVGLAAAAGERPGDGEHATEADEMRAVLRRPSVGPGARKGADAPPGLLDVLLLTGPSSTA